MNETPQVGDIWEEMDPRTEYHRFVKVVQVGKAGVFIHKVEKADGTWITPARAPTREAQLKRFHGRNGGYRLHQRSGGSGLEQSPSGFGDGQGDSELTPAGSRGGRAPAIR